MTNWKKGFKLLVKTCKFNEISLNDQNHKDEPFINSSLLLLSL